MKQTVEVFTSVQMFHTHTSMSHTIFHTQLRYTQLFTYNLFAHRSSTTSLVCASMPIPLKILEEVDFVGLSGPLISWYPPFLGRFTQLFVENRMKLRHYSTEISKFCHTSLGFFSISVLFLSVKKLKFGYSKSVFYICPSVLLEYLYRVTFVEHSCDTCGL